jgi:hypothetical protein
MQPLRQVTALLARIAFRLKASGKSCLVPGMDLDVLMLEPRSLEVVGVIAQGCAMAAYGRAQY